MSTLRTLRTLGCSHYLWPIAATLPFSRSCSTLPAAMTRDGEAAWQRSWRLHCKARQLEIAQRGGGNNATGLPDLNSRREQILTVTGWLFCSFIMSPTWTFIHLCSSNLEENGPCEFPQPSALTMRQNKAKETGKAKMDEDMSREGQLVLVACSGQSRTSSVSFDKSLSPVLSSVLQR